MTWELREVPSEEGSQAWGLYYNGTRQPICILRCEESFAEKVLLALRFVDPDHTVRPGQEQVLTVSPPVKSKTARAKKAK